MYRQNFLCVILILFTVFFYISYAQLTFTPAWGKRSANFMASQYNTALNPTNENCKTSPESLLLIYRLIQAEAQKYVECNKNNM